MTVAVNGGKGNPAPTGSVVLSSGAYTSAATALSGGSASVNVPAGSLAAGSATLSVAYTPDAGSAASYAAASGSAKVTVTKITPTVTVTPASTSIPADQDLKVTVAVARASRGRDPDRLRGSEQRRIQIVLHTAGRGQREHRYSGGLACGRQHHAHRQPTRRRGQRADLQDGYGHVCGDHGPGGQQWSQ